MDEDNDLNSMVPGSQRAALNQLYGLGSGSPVIQQQPQMPQMPPGQQPQQQMQQEPMPQQSMQQQQMPPTPVTYSNFMPLPAPQRPVMQPVPPVRHFLTDDEKRNIANKLVATRQGLDDTTAAMQKELNGNPTVETAIGLLSLAAPRFAPLVGATLRAGKHRKEAALNTQYNLLAHNYDRLANLYKGATDEERKDAEEAAKTNAANEKAQNDYGTQLRLIAAERRRQQVADWQNPYTNPQKLAQAEWWKQKPGFEQQRINNQAIGNTIKQQNADQRGDLIRNQIQNTKEDNDRAERYYAMHGLRDSTTAIQNESRIIEQGYKNLIDMPKGPLRDQQLEEIHRAEYRRDRVQNGQMPELRGQAGSLDAPTEATLQQNPQQGQSISQTDPIEGINAQMKALLPALKSQNSAQRIQASRQWAALKAKKAALGTSKPQTQPPPPSGVAVMPAPSGGGELGQKTPPGKKAPTKTGFNVPPPPPTSPSLVPQMTQSGSPTPGAQMQGGSDQFGPAQEGEVEFVRGGRRYRMPMEAFQTLFSRGGGGAQQADYEERE